MIGRQPLDKMVIQLAISVDKELNFCIRMLNCNELLVPVYGCPLH